MSIENHVETSYSVVYDEADEPERLLHVAGATTDPVKDYLRQIGKVPLLNAEQEVSLAKDIEAGLYAEHLLTTNSIARLRGKNRLTIDEAEELTKIGADAMNHMLEANLRLVVSIAKRYASKGMPFIDIIQEGNLGLVRAVEKFDYTKGYKFSTYATWWIRQSITRAMADQSRTIRIPVHAVEKLNKINRVRRQMLGDLGREATIDEIAKEVDLEPARIIELEKAGRDPISLQSLLGDDSSSEFGNMLEDTQAVATDETAVFTELQKDLQAALDTLGPRTAKLSPCATD